MLPDESATGHLRPFIVEPTKRPRRARVRERNRGGRPVKLTTESAMRIVASLCRGDSFEDAARAGGVGPSTLHRWVQLGKSGDQRFATLAGAIDEATDRGRRRGLDDTLRQLLPYLPR